MFWKKEPELTGLGPAPGPELGIQRDVGINSDSFELNQDPFANPGFENTPSANFPSAFQQMQQTQQQKFMPAASFSETSQTTLQKDVEILSAKIDALRASIESMNQRIINIENIAKAEQEKQQKVRW